MKYPWKPRSVDIPAKPGVYRFSNKDNRIIYVGKAINLKNRLGSYFSSNIQHPRTEEMLSNAVKVDWLIVNSDVEALQLEHTWINEFNPQFNVRFRDDKSYPWICFTMKENVPRISVVRGKRRKDNVYFGPYPNARQARELTDNLLRVFPVRSCNDQVFNRAHRTNRACMLFDIGKCSAPCTGEISETEHRALVNEFISAIKGNFRSKKREIEEKMREAAQNHEFERAAFYRDQVSQLEAIYQPTSVVLKEEDNFDVFAIFSDDLELSIQIFKIRFGFLTSQKHFLLDKVEEMSANDLFGRILPQYYGEDPLEVTEIIVNEPIENEELLAHLIRKSDKKIRIYTPERGRKRELVKLAFQNAQSALELNRSVRAHDIAKRSLALNDLTNLLSLQTAPLRIECVDISHLSGTNTVGSLVVFEDGMPKKSDYRHYALRDMNDDLEAIKEVLARRLKRLKDQDEGWATAPDLLVIDGGPLQAKVALEVVTAFELKIPVISLAKRFETIFDSRTGREVIVPRNSEALFLLQRIRDEAHRFAITHQQASRKKGIRSQLEQIPGLGPHRIKKLLAHFGSLKRLKMADVSEIASVSGISDDLAKTIHETLQLSKESAVNATTGEVIEGA